MLDQALLLAVFDGQKGEIGGRAPGSVSVECFAPTMSLRERENRIISNGWALCAVPEKKGELEIVRQSPYRPLTFAVRPKTFAACIHRRWLPSTRRTRGCHQLWQTEEWCSLTPDIQELV